MFVHRGCVLDGGFEQFGVRVRGQGHRAVHLAGKLAAIDVFACHVVLPAHAREGLCVIEHPTRSAECTGCDGASRRGR
ncbi:hypothetical protein D3C87_1871890 [compost metagenome]